jgi:hypothetical protein
MAKKYMPKDVFEVASSMLAQCHIETGEEIQPIAEQIWSGYSNSIIDDGIVNDLISAATTAIQFLEKENFENKPGYFHHFTYYCMNFNDDWNMKKRKLLNGLWFAKSQQDRNRVENYLKKVKIYYIGIKSGIIPTAPDGWSLSNR